MPKGPSEIQAEERSEGLRERVLAGEVFVIRGLLQDLGLYQPMVEASLEGIRKGAGPSVASQAEEHGFDRVHEWVEASDIPAMTEAVYQEMTPRSRLFLDKIVPQLFGKDESYYFERDPNVRFHIPYDLTAASQKNYEKFAESHGQGKITAHGPHRDSWVDCPANAVNIWIAVGPVTRGNGLSIYAEDYQRPIAFHGGYIEPDETVRQPMNFDLAPGDAILFHGDHLHASEINQTGSTRYVVSYRLTVGKPHFPNGHYHHYLHAGWHGSALRPLAELPANFQTSYIATRLHWIRERLLGGPSGALRTRPKASAGANGATQNGTAQNGAFSIALEDLPVGAVRPVSKGICVARLSENEVIAVGRRCTHQGADLSGGWVADGKLVCPWHNLHYDSETGAPPCKSLRPLRRYACQVKDGQIHVQPDAKVSEEAVPKVDA